MQNCQMNTYNEFFSNSKKFNIFADTGLLDNKDDIKLLFGAAIFNCVVSE